MQSMLAVVEIDAVLLQTPVILVQQWAKALRKKHCIWIDLDSPSGVSVHTILDDPSPECHEDLSVQCSAKFTSHLTFLCGVNLVAKHMFCNSNFLAAVDSPTVTLKDAQLFLMLHGEKPLFVAVRHHQSQTKQRVLLDVHDI